MSARARAWILTSALAVIVASPVARPPGWDDFPISSYPMFSRGDLGSVVALRHVLLERADGTTSPAPPASIGTPEPMVAKGIVERAVARGDATALCERVARRIGDDRGGSGFTRVAVVTSVFDVKAYFASEEGRAPRSREVHARCEVPR